MEGGPRYKLSGGRKEGQRVARRKKKRVWVGPGAEIGRAHV